MKIQFLATDGWDCEFGNDASGILVNRSLMIDTGYYGAQSLKRVGMRPEEIEHIFFTHMHHDHYMGLPMIMFHYLQVGKPLKKLHLYGPCTDLARVTWLATEFLQAGSRHPFYKDREVAPTFHSLQSGDTFETPELTVRVGNAFHAIDCLSARVTEKSSGKILGVTGDTFYCESVVENLTGCDLLVHETALGDSPVDYANPPSCRHSSIDVSLRTARECGAKRLAVIHFAEKNSASVLKKAEGSGIEVFYPELFKEYEI